MKDCFYCGYRMDRFDAACPRCHGTGTYPNQPQKPAAAPMIPTTSLGARRIERPLTWAGAALTALVLGSGVLAFRHNWDDVIPPAATPLPTPTAAPAPLPATVITPGPTPPTRSVAVPPPVTLTPPVVRRRAASGNSPTVNPTRSWSFESAPAAPRVLAADPDASVRGALNLFAAEDVNRLANQIRSASSVEELNALYRYVSELQDRYSANGAGGGVGAINALKAAIIEKRNGPNPAGLTFWQNHLRRAESLAAEATRRARMTPEERKGADNEQLKRILEFENQSNWRNSRRAN